jgi:hypothetical protein
MNKKILVICNYENTIKWRNYYVAFKSQGYKVYSLCFSNRDVESSISAGLIPIDTRKVKPNSEYNEFRCGWDFNYSWSRQGITPKKNEINDFKKKIIEVLLSGGYRFIFGEKTWPYEIAISLLAKQLALSYLTPVCLRIPQKYTFLSAEYEVPLNIKDCLSDDEVDEIIRSQKNGEKPDYFANNNNIKFSTKIAANMRNIMSGQPERLTNVTWQWRINNVIGKWRNKLLMDSMRTNNGTRYCVYVHVQPEASIDYLGEGLRKNNILIDWLSIINVENFGLKGIDDICSIKFHSNYLGQFQGFDKHCSWLTKNNVNSEENLSNGVIPITVSGTIALESLWHGVPPIVLGRPYFESFRGVTKVTNFSEFKDALLNPMLNKIDLSLLESDLRSISTKCFNSEDPQSIEKYVAQI